MSEMKNIAKDETLSDNNSVCDLMRTNTSEVLQKIEFQIPILLQGYTDLFIKYLHSFDSMFGACRMSEKQFFDKLGVNHYVLEETVSYWNLIKNLTILQIESHSKFLQDYFDFRMSTMESFDKSIHAFSEYYAQTLYQLNTKSK